MIEWVQYLPAILSAIASLVGVLISNNLTAFRLEQLEKKVDKHNNVIERMYRVETRVDDLVNDVRTMERKM